VQYKLVANLASALLALLLVVWVPPPYNLPIEGTKSEVAVVQAAIATFTLEEAAFLYQSTDRVVIWGSGAAAWIGSGTTTIGVAGQEIRWIAGALLHEAQHHWDYYKCTDVSGAEFEARAIRRHADYLDRVGSAEEAETMREAIGKHIYGYWGYYTAKGCSFTT
jgi:hypothetical protein